MNNMKEVRAIENLNDMTNIIKSELDNIAEGFIAVGYYLKKTRDDNLYKQKGYANIFDYAKDAFNIGRSTATRFMEINDRFSMGGYSPQIETKYHGYGSSKLTEMLGLPEEIRDTIPVEATVKDIREAKTVVRETEHHYSPQMELCDVAPKEDEEVSWPVLTVKEFFKKEKKSFEQMVDWIRKDAGREKQGIEEDILAIVNPTKFKMFRLPTANVLMSEKQLQVMPYRDQGEKETFTYLEFAKAFEEVFFPNYPDASEPINDIYEKEYGEPLYEKKEKPVPEEKKKNDSRPVHKVETKPKKAEKPVEKPEETPKKVEQEATSDQPKTEEEQIPGQTELTKDFPEYCPENSSNSKVEAEIEAPKNYMNRPYQTRKKYMDKLPLEDMGAYMARTMKETIQKTLRKASVQIFSQEFFWKSFFAQEVDEKGDAIEEVTNV